MSRTPLTLAALDGKTAEIRRLLQQGSGVDEKDGYGCTALILAAANGHLEAVRLLLEKGAGVDLKHNGGRTALHCAAWQGHVEVAKELLRAGASTDIRDNDNMTALDRANRNNKSEVANVLRDPQAHVAPAKVREQERGGGTAGERRSTSLCAFLNICFKNMFFASKDHVYCKKIILAGFFYHSAKWGGSRLIFFV